MPSKNLHCIYDHLGSNIPSKLHIMKKELIFSIEVFGVATNSTSWITYCIKQQHQGSLDIPSEFKFQNKKFNSSCSWIKGHWSDTKFSTKTHIVRWATTSNIAFSVIDNHHQISYQDLKSWNKEFKSSYNWIPSRVSDPDSKFWTKIHIIFPIRSPWVIFNFTKNSKFCSNLWTKIHIVIQIRIT